MFYSLCVDRRPGLVPASRPQTLWLHARGRLLLPVIFAHCTPWPQAGRLGCVVFQFQLSFKPSAANKAYVLRCRSMLRADVAMAVEFRSRAWFAGQGH